MINLRERLQWVGEKRQAIELNLREAEILHGLIRRHLVEADRLTAELEAAPPEIPETEPDQRRVLPDEVDEMVSEFLEGKSAAEIAREFGRPIVTVSKYLKESGVAVNSSRNRLIINPVHTIKQPGRDDELRMQNRIMRTL